MTSLMPAEVERAKLRWEDGVPISVRYEDPYYARSDGLAEARHVFLDGNDLTSRFQKADSIHIAELGFGTGLNCLAAFDLWRRIGTGAVRYTTFEAFPMSAEARREALSVWPEMAALAPVLDAGTEGFELHIVVGDAREEVARWLGTADAWFLDGFAPSRNPEMWEPLLMRAVFDKTRQGGTFATYSAAGHVRRALESVGFSVAKRPGFGTKREMLTGKKT